MILLTNKTYQYEPQSLRNTMQSAYAKTKTQISFAVTLVMSWSAFFVFATWIVQYLYWSYERLEFPAFYPSPVAVQPGLYSDLVRIHIVGFLMLRLISLILLELLKERSLNFSETFLYIGVLSRKVSAMNSLTRTLNTCNMGVCKTILNGLEVPWKNMQVC